MVEIQANKPITAIDNIKKINSFVSRSEFKEVQLQYDEAEEDIAGEQLENAVSKINNHLLGINAQFQYRIHEGTERVMVKLVDMETNDVIKEIPPEKMLDIVAEIWKRVGLVIDHQK
ncbi:flagellar protein FlaG [Desemzia sp. RIT804]|uniref:flagellar protein FlaG n=1 Tax=Desemzia sp. RIT 804 TaxID=2810209 RepID=UPI001950BA7D|nr:flagellar protein FlaG [Desemzia sp. RIT 804]MBM6614707.1 flagellar protein FlaG [Desemzia sp. RIT 804]